MDVAEPVSLITPRRELAAVLRRNKNRSEAAGAVFEAQPSESGADSIWNVKAHHTPRERTLPHTPREHALPPNSGREYTKLSEAPLLPVNEDAAHVYSSDDELGFDSDAASPHVGSAEAVRTTAEFDEPSQQRASARIPAFGKLDLKDIHSSCPSQEPLCAIKGDESLPQDGTDFEDRAKMAEMTVLILRDELAKARARAQQADTRADEAEQIAVWIKLELDRSKTDRSTSKDFPQDALSASVAALQDEVATLRQKRLSQERENRHLQLENDKLLEQIALDKISRIPKSARRNEDLRELHRKNAELRAKLSEQRINQEEFANLRQRVLSQERENRNLQTENDKLLEEIGLDKTRMLSKTLHTNVQLGQLGLNHTRLESKLSEQPRHQEELASLRQRLLSKERENADLQAENKKLSEQLVLDKSTFLSETLHLNKEFKRIGVEKTEHESKLNEELKNQRLRVNFLEETLKQRSVDTSLHSLHSVHGFSDWAPILREELASRSPRKSGKSNNSHKSNDSARSVQREPASELSRRAWEHTVLFQRFLHLAHKPIEEARRLCFQLDDKQPPALFDPSAPDVSMSLQLIVSSLQHIVELLRKLYGAHRSRDTLLGSCIEHSNQSGLTSLAFDAEKNTSRNSFGPGAPCFLLDGIGGLLATEKASIPLQSACQ